MDTVITGSTDGTGGARSRWPALLLDLGLPAALVVVGLAEVWVPFSSVLGEGSQVLTSVVVVATSLLLTVRRRWPAVGLVVLAAWLVTMLFVSGLVLFWGAFVPMVLAVFSLARYGRGRLPFVGAGAAAATLLSFDVFVEELNDPGEIVFHWLVFTVTWSVGFGLRSYERRAAASTQRAVAAEVAAAEQAMAAVVAERTRIARELHDVVAHSVSVMVVQAGAAEQVVGEDDEMVRRALATVRTTGQEALADMRHVVEILRGTPQDQPAGLAPQPGLGALAGLVESVRDAGLQVDLEVQGKSRPLPAGVDLAAYRVVQEALTNVRKHAATSSARLRLEWSEQELRIEVVDQGRGGQGHPAGRGGHGLVGMRERVGLYGGTMSAGPRREGGFAVRVVLPVPPLAQPVERPAAPGQPVEQVPR